MGEGKWTVVAVAVALALGYWIGRIDAAPGWDDAGITVALLLVASGVLGLLVAPKRAWLVALAVGAWIPAFEVPHSGNYAALAALAFALAGAYAGAWARRVVGGTPSVTR